MFQPPHPPKVPNPAGTQYFRSHSRIRRKLVTRRFRSATFFLSLRHALQILKKSGIRNSRAFRAANDRFTLGGQARHRKGHGDAMVAFRIDFCAVQFPRLRPSTFNPSGRSSTFAPMRFKFSASAAMRSLSFTRNSVASRISIPFSVYGPSAASMGSSSINSAICSPSITRLSGRTLHRQIADNFAVGAAQRRHLNGRAHR